MSEKEPGPIPPCPRCKVDGWRIDSSFDTARCKWCGFFVTEEWADDVRRGATPHRGSYRPA